MGSVRSADSGSPYAAHRVRAIIKKPDTPDPLRERVRDVRRETDNIGDGAANGLDVGPF